MKKTKHFNISVPELGDAPDITQVSNAISDLEDATAGTLEIMKAEMQGTKITLTSVSRKTKRTGYYEGMSIRFKSPQDIEPNYLKTISVDDLGDQELSVAYKVNRNEYIDIVYEGNKFTAYPVVVQKTDSVNNNSSVLVGTAKGVKTAYDKGMEALNKANQAQTTADEKENKIEKKSGFNLEKTSDYKESDANKVFTQKGANDLYKEVENEIDGKLPLSGGRMEGPIVFRSSNFSKQHQFVGYNNADDDLNERFHKSEMAWSYTGTRERIKVVNGFPMENNANGLLSFNTNNGLYGHQIGMSSNGRLYHRHAKNGEINRWKMILESDSEKSGFNLDKSDSVTSNSSNTLATSLAVKTAYDKASQAQSSANKAQSTADGKVSKSGDTMTGNIHNDNRDDVEGVMEFTRYPTLRPKQYVGAIQTNWYDNVAKFGIMRGASDDLNTSSLKFTLNSQVYDIYHTGYLDSKLTTSSKTVSGAINELKSSYVQDIRLGALVSAEIYNGPGMLDKNGYVITGVTNYNADRYPDNITGRPIQKKINGVWYTISSVL